MIRRVHVARLLPGDLTLEPGEAHHVRDVLRLAQGAELELFDDAGATARGTISTCNPRHVIVRVQQVGTPADAHLAEQQQPSADSPPTQRFDLVVASAVPKAARADWMIEKLSELGVSAYIPLATARSVVHPEGAGKLDRWRRIAVEAAKQSRRPGVMRIDPLMPLAQAAAQVPDRHGWVLCTDPTALPCPQALQRLDRIPSLTLFIGPEGGWTDQETASLTQAGLTPVALTATILRVETAAITAAAVVASWTAIHRP